MAAYPSLPELDMRLAVTRERLGSGLEQLNRRMRESFQPRRILRRHPIVALAASLLASLAAGLLAGRLAAASFRLLRD